MRLVFWLSVGFVGYVYIGYPLLLMIWARLSGRAANRRSGVRAADSLPSISIVMAARNEARRLGARIENLLALDYPDHLRQIIVVSDGSTDDTLTVLAPFRNVVDVVVVPPNGKASALNAGVAQARHEIVVFADARQMFARDALKQLTDPFADPAIGGVTGELVLDVESKPFANRRNAAERRSTARKPVDRRQRVPSTIDDGVGLYWRYEKALRRREGIVGSTLGATGAIYAIRRALWQPLPAATILDDVLAPMRVVLAGFRVVFNERALAFDRAALDAEAELRRKVRTLAGNFQILRLEPRLLLPWRNPVWLQYVSHKLGRLMVPYALLTIFATSIVLSGTRFYLIALVIQVAFYLLAGYGAFLEITTTLRAPRQAQPASTAVGVREVA